MSLNHTLQKMKKIITYLVIFSHLTTSCAFAGPTSSQDASEESMVVGIRSKTIRFDDVSPVHLQDLAQSAEENITILARGDVVLHKFCVQRNLNIQTEGQVIFENEGTIGESCTIEAKEVLVKKHLKTEGFFEFKGRNFTNTGHLMAKRGASLLTENAVVNKGKVTVDGKELLLAGTTFDNFGDIESFKGIRGSISESSTNKGSIRTRNNFIFQSGSFTNDKKASLFTFGIHQLDIQNLYQDAGSVYSPLLLFLRAGAVEYKDSHRFFGNEAIIHSFLGNIEASANSKFFSRLYLQFNSQADIQHGGTVEASFDQSYPYLDYFKTKFTSALPQVSEETATDLEEQILALPLEQWEQVSQLRHQIHGQFEKAVVFNAMGNLYRRGMDRVDHGSIIYRADGLSNMERHTCWAGVFKGNDLLINTATLLMDEVRLSSPAGLIEAQARISAQIKKSTYEGEEGVRIAAQKALEIEQLSTSAPLTTITAPTISIRDAHAQGSLSVTGKKIKKEGTIESTETLFMEADDMEARGLTKGKQTEVRAHKMLQDDPTSRIQGDQTAVLYIPNNSSFQGEIKGDEVTVHIKDMNLVNLLSHLQTNTANIHLDSDVVLDKNTTIHPTLHLWATSLTNKAKVTGDKDFVAYVQERFINEGGLAVKGMLGVKAKEILNQGVRDPNGTIQSASLTGHDIILEALEGSIESLYGEFKAEQNSHMKAKKHISLKASTASAGENNVLEADENILIESLKRREQTQDGYIDHKEESSLHAGEHLVASAGHDMTFIGANTTSKAGTHFQAGNNIIDQALALESESHSASDDFTQKETSRVYEVCQHSSEGAFVAHAMGRYIGEAPQVDARSISIKGVEGGVQIRDVHNIHTSQTSSQTDGGTFGESRNYQSQSSDQQSQGAKLTAKESIMIFSENGPIALANVICIAPKTILEAPLVQLLLGESSSNFASSEQKSDFWWQSLIQRKEEHRTHAASTFSGELEVKAKETIIEQVKGKTLDFMERMAGDPGKIITSLVEDLHNVEEKKVEGPSKALAAIVAIAASIATAGAGSAIAASLYGAVTTGLTSILSSMTAAAFSSICSQAAVALVSCKGDPLKAAEFLASEESLKSLGISVITAGATSGLGQVFKIPTEASQLESFGDHAANNTLRGGVNVAVGSAFGQNPEEAALSSLRVVAAGTLQGVAAHAIGDAHQSGQLDGFTSKIFHTVAGASAGIILSSGDPLSGLISGGIGGLAAETGAEVAGSMGVDANLAAGIGRITTVTTAAFTGQNIDIAQMTGTTAVENNFLAHQRKGEEKRKSDDSDDRLAILVPQDFSASPFDLTQSSCEDSLLKVFKSSPELSEAERFQALQASQLYRRIPGDNQRNFLIDLYENLHAHSPEAYIGNIYLQVLDPSATASNYSLAAQYTAHDPINNRVRWALQSNLLQYGIEHGRVELNQRIRLSPEFSYQTHEFAFQFSNNVPTIGRCAWEMIKIYDVSQLFGEKAGGWLINQTIENFNSPHGFSSMPWGGKAVRWAIDTLDPYCKSE
jgi:hypothetical protein